MRFCRALIDSLLPPGPLWTPEQGEGLDALLDGMAECLDGVRLDLLQLARVRNADLTPILADVEREYGLMSFTSADEATRRRRLAAAKAAGRGDGSLSFLQDVLDTAGFNVQVHANNPPVDPGFFLFYTPSAICGNAAAICGDSSAGALRGELLVNGVMYQNQVPVRYEVPTDPGYWPLFFFVGGAATRNAAGELTDIADAQVPADRKAELVTLILRCKPMHSWAGLRIELV